jgi:hypothetical protein
MVLCDDTSMTPTFERLDLTLSDWGRILSQFEDRTLFQSPAWHAFIAKTQQAEPVFAVLREGSSTLGYFSGLIVTRLGFRILGSPLPGWTTSYMGMNLFPGVSRRRGIEAVLRLAFGALNCVHVEMMDRHLALEDARELGFANRIYSGFEVDLTQSVADLFGNMTSACRRCIRAAEKRGVVIEEAYDPEFADEYYAQLQDVFRKRSLVPTYGSDRVRELITCLTDSGQLLLLRARDQSGRCIATGIFPASHDTMYFWGGASWKDSLGYRPNEAIQWYAMQYWRSRGVRRYDMGGGGEYKRKFGGKEIAIPWVRRSRYPAVERLRGIAQQAFRWRQALFGVAVKLMKGRGPTDATTGSEPCIVHNSSRGHATSHQFRSWAGSIYKGVFP